MLSKYALYTHSGGEVGSSKPLIIAVMSVGSVLRT